MKPKAIIIKGNPWYLTNPDIAPLAAAFYADVKALLDAGGYEVLFDAGEPYTTPDVTAVLWVAHSRGIDRLQYAPDGITTLPLVTMEGADCKEPGLSPAHYQLSSESRAAIEAIARQK